MGDEVTREQHERLAAELRELEGPRRAEIVQTIAVARSEGDLSENFAYHDAKNAQGLLERRITMLRARLHEATVVESGTGDVVSAGDRIVVADEKGSRLEIELSALGGDGTVSPSSPLGAAVLGKRVGDTVEVRAPRGAWQATIVEIRS